MATLAGSRSLPTLEATFATQAALKKALNLPAAPPGYQYVYPLVQPLVDANNVPTNLPQALKAGFERGVQIQEIPKQPSLLQEIANTASIIGGIVAAPFTGGSSLLGTLKTVYSVGTAPTILPKTVQTIQPVRTPMGIFDDIFSASQGIFGANTGSTFGQILDVGTSIASKFLQPTASFPVPGTPGNAVAMPAMASVPAVVGAAGRVGAVVGRGFFQRFPNLATSIQTLRNGGMNVTRSKLYGVMKRFGPEFLVSGGLLTAAAVNELAVAGPGRRRMNPANSRALQRAARRIKSFHKLCRHTDVLASHRRRSVRH